MVIDGWLFALTLVTALGCGAMGGVFFTFSTFVMRALARRPAREGISAMQSINREAPTPWFMTGLFGTAVLCLVLVVTSIIKWDEPYAGYLLAGSLCYLVGTILLTIAYHIPQNVALDAVDPNSPGAAEQWARYVERWTAWNHVRTAGGMSAAALLTIALTVD